MATSREYFEFILEQLSDLEEISSRSMMGEYIIYYRAESRHTSVTTGCWGSPPPPGAPPFCPRPFTKRLTRARRKCCWSSGWTTRRF